MNWTTKSGKYVLNKNYQQTRLHPLLLIQDCHLDLEIFAMMMKAMLIVTHFHLYHPYSLSRQYHVLGKFCGLRLKFSFPDLLSFHFEVSPCFGPKSLLNPHLCWCFTARHNYENVNVNFNLKK